MKTLTRRQFGCAVAAAAPFVRSIGLGAAPVVVGVTTSSFRDLPRLAGRDNVDDVIRALQSVRATDIELALANVEPAPPSLEPVMAALEYVNATR